MYDIDYVNIPETTVAFNQKTPGCVTVTFTAAVMDPDFGFDNTLWLRASLDGKTFGLPSDVEIQGRTGGTMQFIFKNVSAGNHTIRMQFSSGNDTGISVTRTVTVVEHH